MTYFAVLPPPVRTYIGDFVSRRRRVRLVRAVGIAVGLLLFWMLAWCVVDRLIPLPAWLRLLLMATGLVAVVVLLLRPLRDALARHIDWVTAAAEIEQRNSAFAERLQTVTSRLLGPPKQRGSDELIGHLLGQVEAQVREDQPQRLMPWSHAWRGWIPAGALIVLIAALCTVPWLDLPRLMLRFLAPLAPVAPASNTRIEASHSPEQVIQGEPVTFRATATRLDDRGLRLQLSTDGRNWTTRAMPPAGDGFAYVLPAAERDFRYAVAGGDARTLERFVRVLRRPALVELRIRYAYPDYAQRPPLTVTSSDGTIEAPAGTEASIAIVATEPLADARLRIGDDELPTQPTVEPTVRQAKLKIERDASWELLMTSADGATGEGPGRMSIRALPDRAPIVRLVQPSEDLRLTPRDVVGLRYLAMDDFGLRSLRIVAAVNGADRQQVDLNLRGDPRRQEGRIDLDLATLAVQIGDVVRLRVEAADRGGQSASSDVRHILISPRSIDMNTYLRLAELAQARSLAKVLDDELKAAREAYHRIPEDQRRYAEGWLVTGEYDQHLVSAGEAGLLLRQTLLRAMTRSASPEDASALANLVDNAQLATSLADHTLTHAPLENAAAIDSLLGRAQDKAGKLQERLKILHEGERSVALAADRANLAALTERKDAADEAARRTLERFREEVADAVRELGLKPDAAGLDAQLQTRAEAMKRLVKELPAIDFAAVSRTWAARPEDLREPVALPERLAAAAQAEAVRPDADLLRARDLQLASQAASALAERVVVVSEKDVRRPAELGEYPAALAALQREHQLNRRSQDVRDPKEVQRIADEAETARRKMRQWAGLEEPSQIAAADAGPLAAMESSALHQQKRYDEARKLDEKLAEAAQSAHQQPADAPAEPNGRVPEAPERMALASAQRAHAATPEPQGSFEQVARERLAEERRRRELAEAMDRSQKLDEIAASQRQIAEATARRRAEEAEALSRQQAEVAEALEQVRKQSEDPLDVVPDERQPDTRGEAMAAIAAAQQRLAAMPQQLSAAQEAAARHREAQAAARSTQEAARAAPADQKDAAQRVAAQAERSAQEAAERMEQAAAQVSPDTAEAMARQLEPFAPETLPAVGALQTKLGGALRSLRQSMGGSDAAATERAAGEARQAIRAVQEELREAQARLAQQDPLVAAKWFAREASAALAMEPPDFETAIRSQGMAQMALARAWQQSVREASQHRFAGTGAMRVLYQLELLLPLSGGAGVGAAGPDLAGPPGPRQWGHARRREETDRTAAPAEADPPGYQEALRAYFEALGKEGGK